MTHVESETDRRPIVQQIVERSFSQHDGKLRIGPLLVTDLAQRHKTPLFVYDSELISRQWRRLRSALPESVSLYYSIKANPNQAILRHLLAHGVGLEVASAGELYRSIEAGCDPKQIIFAGPGKTDEELYAALSSRISAIHAESIGELQRVIKLANRLGVRAPVGLRVNPVEVVQGGAMRMGGKASPFGIDEEQLDEAIAVVTQSAALEWHGLHFYSGTQILDAETLGRQYHHTIEVAKKAGETFRQPLKTLDFGGGLGIPYFDHELELDLGTLSSVVADVIATAREHWALRDTQFIVEPGRYLVAEAGVYVTRVLDVKQSRGKAFAVVDGGMHHHLAASGNLGQTIKRNFPIAVLNKLDAPVDRPIDIVGCLCTPLDTFGRSVPLPRLEPGDLIGVFQSGAYALSASPQEFLSHSPPAEIWINNDIAQNIVAGTHCRTIVPMVRENNWADPNLNPSLPGP